MPYKVEVPVVQETRTVKDRNELVRACVLDLLPQELQEAAHFEIAGVKGGSGRPGANPCRIPAVDDFEHAGRVAGPLCKER